MKNKWIFILLIFVLSACDDLTFRYFTRINSDGTVYKRVVAEGDSSAVYGQPFSFDVDDGWTVKYDKKIQAEVGDTLFYAIAERTFASVSEVTECFKIENDSVFLDNIEVTLESKFLWFFTFYEYKEAFIQRFPYRHLSIDDYLSKEEFAYVFMDDTKCVEHMTKEEEKVFDNRSEEKFWQFITNSLAIEFVRLANGYARDNSLDFLNKKDSIFANEIFSSSIENSPEVNDVCLLVDKRKGVTWLSAAFQSGWFSEFERQIEDEVILIDNSDYSAQLEVPGFIYETNANELEDNVPKWAFKRGGFLYKDMVLVTKYRTINYWAFMLVGLLVVLLGLSFFKRPKG
ncbi:hypothetical protein [Carboxylicivirga sp. M1479]|uniref:hypothetical protein n=1 Tax=Carboxylicivirga sp. M1479 TaxID=2594476 RepID=UPI00117853B0|nr:hypothetical protein [Carboxylicivirga sp. M1479]TRX65850.1 hypothetical protein FNN09_17255 [Carboxylicivirga sp. M1479]